MRVVTCGYTRHGTEAVTEYTISDTEMGGAPLDSDQILVWLEENTLDFYQILGFRAEHPEQVIEWSTVGSADILERMVNLTTMS